MYIILLREIKAPTNSLLSSFSHLSPFLCLSHLLSTHDYSEAQHLSHARAGSTPLLKKWQSPRCQPDAKVAADPKERRSMSRLLIFHSAQLIILPLIRC